MGADKHAAKGKGQAYGGNKTGKIYSYSTLNARKDVAKNFCNYVKEHYPEVKKASVKGRARPKLAELLRHTGKL